MHTWLIIIAVSIPNQINTGASRYLELAYFESTTYVEELFHSRTVSPLFYCISTLFVSNSVNMKTLLFWSDSLFPVFKKQFYIILPSLVSKSICRPKRRHALFVNHLQPRNCLPSAIQKSNNLFDEQSNLPLNHRIITFNWALINPLLQMMSN